MSGLRQTILRALTSRGMGSYGANEAADEIMADPLVASAEDVFEALRSAETAITYLLDTCAHSMATALSVEELNDLEARRRETRAAIALTAGRA